MSKFKIIMIILLVNYLLQINCSIILPTVVSYKNKKTPVLSEINNFKALNKIYRDDKIKIIKKDGEIIQGSFIDIYRHEESKYFSLYNEFQKKFTDYQTPNINDIITVLLKSNKIMEGNFLGFDFYQIYMKSDSTYQIDTIDILEIQEIRFNNSSIHSKQLIVLFNYKQNSIPIYSCIAYKVDKIKYIISFNEISTLEKINKKHSVPGYFLLGFLGDSFLVFCAITYIGASVGAGLR